MPDNLVDIPDSVLLKALIEHSSEVTADINTMEDHRSIYEIQ